MSQKFGVRRGSEQVLKEVGINCWEVPRDKLPCMVSDLCTLAPVSLRFLLGISDTASNISFCFT
jgi:hypothetical protein